MALTRPTARQINTSVNTVSDPLSVLNKDSTEANIDVGFIFNRDGGISSNVAIIWQESADQLVFGLTSNSGSINSNVSISDYANVRAGYFIGDGSQLTGLGTASYSNVQVATYLPTHSGAISSSVLTVTGNVIQGTVPILTSSSTTTSIGTSAVAIDTFVAAEYRSAKYVISINDITNTQFQTCEIILVQDGTTATISIYSIVFSGTTDRMNFTADIASGTVTLYGTGISVNNTVKLVRTLIPV
jgi:hypothetical protein